jgi:hypothetical protein
VVIFGFDQWRFVAPTFFLLHWYYIIVIGMPETACWKKCVMMLQKLVTQLFVSH